MTTAFRLIGKDFTPLDLEAKVTGKARYSGDFRADGMTFIRILALPMPHAKVNAVDLSNAEAVLGFRAALVPDEVKQPAAPGQPVLSAEPAYVGQPIVAIAAETEQVAEDAIALADLTPSYRPSLYKTGWAMKEVIDAEEEAFSRRDHQQAA